MSKQNLERIEATLSQLTDEDGDPDATVGVAATSPPLTQPPKRLAWAKPGRSIPPNQVVPTVAIPTPSATHPHPVGSVQIVATPPTRSPRLTAPASRSSELDLIRPNRRSSPTGVRPLSARSAALPTLDLPKFKLPNLTQHQNSFNMALPMNLVKQIEAQIEAWQIDLRHILNHIQAIYAEGPIVNGWLEPVEASKTAPQLNTAALQDASTQVLMDYVEHICAEAAATDLTAAATATATVTGTPIQYQLCGLHADGRVWSRPCPPAQLPTISLAIARYRKLQVLLQQKDALELQLQQAATALMAVQAQLQTSSTARSA